MRKQLTYRRADRAITAIVEVIESGAVHGSNTVVLDRAANLIRELRDVQPQRAPRR